MNQNAQNNIYTALDKFVQEKPLLIVNPKKKNGLILIKKYYAEFAGPGAIVGGFFDQDLVDVIPVGKLSLFLPQNSSERQKAYLLRRQWVKLIKQITSNPIPHERAQVILNQFEHWFDSNTAQQLPDEVFAFLVGVLPDTIKKTRDLVNRL
ncbi:hypothetical protein A5482_001875 [Cyanobacterium sp. IPPAS B-1200]|uniref:hypothetical protein n=1 Tax=Cyanobacterium sp. IPPAS B-1200 TaxID=1562720 RepID=UPI00085262E4|nr:hypothetical protein [Cyanobacterium sp. IPPAS B-1200]OEJ79511.1 hypothetical protein A5482_01265 [Cyanobacterium sp. IPPAS B-1200]